MRNRRFFQTFFLATAISIILGVAVVAAEEVYEFGAVAKFQQYFETIDRTKTTESIQRFGVSNVFTSITNPCNDCMIGAKLKSGQNVDSGITVKNGETSDFWHNWTILPGTYKLLWTRMDFSPLNANFRGHWYYNLP